MGNMTEQDWAEFRRLYPDAAAFMDRRTLQRERENLTAEASRFGKGTDPRRKKWVEERLQPSGG